MTKQELQKELQEKIKEGVKPSDLKKLKRSRSVGDLPSEIPKAPPLPNSSPTLSKSKSSESFSDPRYPWTTLISQSEEIDSLKKESQAKSDTIKLLRGKIEKLEKQLKESPPTPLLQEQLKQKQSQVELLKEQLEETNSQFQEKVQELKSAKSELDNSLEARLQANKQYEALRNNLQVNLKTELEKLTDEFSQELLEQDEVVNKLRTERSQLKLKVQKLERDLRANIRLAELKENVKEKPIPTNDWPSFNFSWFYLLSSIMIAWWFLINTKKYDLQIRRI